MVIYKYPLQIIDRQRISMPVDAKILCVQVQREQPCVCALVDPDAENEQVEFSTFGTGHHGVATDADKNYVGTYQINGGGLVFHVFVGARG